MVYEAVVNVINRVFFKLFILSFTKTVPDVVGDLNLVHEGLFANFRCKIRFISAIVFANEVFVSLLSNVHVVHVDLHGDVINSRNLSP